MFFITNDHLLLGILIGNVHHALLEADAEDLVLDLHVDSLERVHVALTHLIKHLIEYLVRVRPWRIILHPLNEAVASLWILLDPHALENGLEGLLGVAGNHELLVLH